MQALDLGVDKAGDDADEDKQDGDEDRCGDVVPLDKVAEVVFVHYQVLSISDSLFLI